MSHEQYFSTAKEGESFVPGAYDSQEVLDQGFQRMEWERNRKALQRAQLELEKDDILKLAPLDAVLAAINKHRSDVLEDLFTAEDGRYLEAFLSHLEKLLPTECNKETRETLKKCYQHLIDINAVIKKHFEIIPQSFRDRLKVIGGRSTYLLGMSRIKFSEISSDQLAKLGVEILKQVRDEKFLHPVDHVILADHYLAKKTSDEKMSTSDELNMLKHYHAAAINQDTQDKSVIFARGFLQTRLKTADEDVVNLDVFDAAELQPEGMEGAYEARKQELTQKALEETRLNQYNQDQLVQYNHDLKIYERESKKHEISLQNLAKIQNKRDQHQANLNSLIQKSKVQFMSIFEGKTDGLLSNLQAMKIFLQKKSISVNPDSLLADFEYKLSLKEILAKKEKSASPNELRHLAFKKINQQFEEINKLLNQLEAIPGQYEIAAKHLTHLIIAQENDIKAALSNSKLSGGNSKILRWGNGYNELMNKLLTKIGQIKALANLVLRENYFADEKNYPALPIVTTKPELPKKYEMTEKLPEIKISVPLPGYQEEQTVLPQPSAPLLSEQEVQTILPQPSAPSPEPQPVINMDVEISESKLNMNLLALSFYPVADKTKVNSFAKPVTETIQAPNNPEQVAQDQKIESEQELEPGMVRSETELSSLEEQPGLPQQSITVAPSSLIGSPSVAPSLMSVQPQPAAEEQKKIVDPEVTQPKSPKSEKSSVVTNLVGNSLYGKKKNRKTQKVSTDSTQKVVVLC